MIPDKIFDSLLMKSFCDTGDDLDLVGFSGGHVAYYINFYGEASDDYKVVVEDFGFRGVNGWARIEPTPAQIARMQEIVLKEVKAITERVDRERAVEAMKEQWGEDERTYGVTGAIYNKYY